MELAARPRRRCTSCWREGAESPAPTPFVCPGGLTPGRRPGAHRDQALHLTVVHGTGAVVRRPQGTAPGSTHAYDAGAATRCAATDAHLPEPRGMAPGLAYPDCTRSRQHASGRRGHPRPPERRERALGLWRPRHATGLATPPARLG